MKKKFAFIAIVSVVALSACGKETVIKEVLVTNPPADSTSSTTQYVAPPANKFNEYLADLRNFSGKANTMDDAFLIEFGSLVCDVFEEGNSLEDVITVLSEYSEGNSDDELYAGVIMSAVVNICPEHRAQVESQL